MASTSSVLPAPVSPVSAVIPGGTTRRRSSTPPRPRPANSVSIAPALAIGEAELGLDDVEEVAALEADEARRVRRRRADDGVAAVHRPQLAPVDGQHRRSVVDELDADALRVVEDEAAVEEHVGRYWGEDERSLSRRHDRAAHGECVCRRTRWRGNDQPVCRVAREEGVVDGYGCVHRVAGAGLLDAGLVQRKELT